MTGHILLVKEAYRRVCCVLTNKLTTMANPRKNEVIFKLEIRLRDSIAKLEVPVLLPFEESKIPEFTQLIISSFGLPIIVEKGKYFICYGGISISEVVSINELFNLA